jgi:hypothetical protein
VELHFDSSRPLVELKCNAIYLLPPSSISAILLASHEVSHDKPAVEEAGTPLVPETGNEAEMMTNSDVFIYRLIYLVAFYATRSNNSSLMQKVNMAQ